MGEGNRLRKVDGLATPTILYLGLLMFKVTRAHSGFQASHNVIRLPPSPIRYCLSGFQDLLSLVYRWSLGLMSMTLMLVEINI